MKTALTLLLLTSVFYSPSLYAQENLLRRKVTFQAEGENLENVFLAISDQAEFTFSYNTSIIPSEKKVSVKAQDETVRSLLGTILPENIDYRVNGNHLILLRKPDNPSSGKKEKYTITGSVYDAVKQEPLSNVLVYEVNGLISSLSDGNGSFTISVPTQFEHLGLSFNKQGFKDTILFVRPVDQQMQVFIMPKKDNPSVEKLQSKFIEEPGQVESITFVQQIVSSELRARTENSNNITRRIAQISFLPMMGSNLKMSGLIENNISINILAGYSYGLKGFEMGGFFNVIRNDMHGFQVSGLGNLVGGNSGGAQVGGLFNHNRGSLIGIQVSGLHNMLIDTLNGVQISGLNNILNGGMNGVQIAGLNNLTTRNVDGVQIAGLSNLAYGDVDAVQFAGMVNMARSVNGAQLSGMANYAKKETSGFQMAGMINFSQSSVEGFQIAGMANYTHKSVDGFQMAGLANASKDVEGFQIAGMINVARGTVSGLQMSGLINYATHTKSSQIGVFNYADTASGIPVGFLSFVRKGFHTLEFSANELTPANLAFKTGVRRFYNIFSGGYGAWSGESLWMYGYGFGTEQPVGKKSFINIEYTTHWVSEEKNHPKDVSLLNRINVSYGYRIPKGPAFSIGPAFNIWLSEWTDPETGEYLTQLAPYTMGSTTIGTTQVQFWIGGRLAIHW